MRPIFYYIKVAVRLIFLLCISKNHLLHSLGFLTFLLLTLFLSFYSILSFRSQHNYLRITRILKSLGELGYESFKSPLVKFILHEALVENTIPNIKQSALEYFVYTIRDRRERRKLLRFAQKHYTPSENFIWGPPKKEPPERSKAQKTPTLPALGSNGQTSTHKKSKDSKNSSAASHLNNKTVEEKKVASREPGEETDKPSPEASSEDTKPRNTEDDNAADQSESPPEKTVTDSAGKGECPTTSSEKDGEGENQSKDSENPENASCHAEVVSQQNVTNPQTSSG